MRVPLRRLLACAAAAFVMATHSVLAAEDTASLGTPRSGLAQDDVDAWVRFKADAAKSSDLRVRIAVSDADIEERDGLFYITPDASLESLVEQAQGSTDPIVLWLLTSRCGQLGADHRRRCDAVAMAERWTLADTQNQAAWLTLAAVLEANGRHVEARAALMRGARASLWREYQFALGRAVAAEVPTRRIAARQRLSLLDMARTIGFGITTSFSTLGSACNDRTMRDTCLRYLDTIARDADNLMALHVVAIYSARAGAPADVVMARSRKADAFLYAITTQLQSDDADVDVALRRMSDRLASSDATLAARYLAEAHITEAEGARRLAAGLTPEERRRRANTVRPRSAEPSASNGS